MLKREKGFTLVELMIVIAIVGVLAGAAILRFTDMINRARESNARNSLASIRSAAVIYYGMNEGSHPENLTDGLVGDYINRLPAVNFRYYDEEGSMDGTIAWESDSESNLTDWNSAPTTDWENPTDEHRGWSYDSSRFSIWIDSGKPDSSDRQIYTW